MARQVPSRRFTRPFQIMLEPGIKEQLDELAKEIGVSTAAFCRQLFDKEISSLQTNVKDYRRKK